MIGRDSRVAPSLGVHYLADAQITSFDEFIVGVSPLFEIVGLSKTGWLATGTLH